MKYFKLFIVIIEAGCLLLGGCGVGKTDNQPTSTIDLEETKETEVEAETVNAVKTEVEAGTVNTVETEVEEEAVKEDKIELIYGEMTENFYVVIEDTIAQMNGNNVVVIGLVKNSPLYINTEVDVLSEGNRMPTSIENIELGSEKVDCVRDEDKVKIMLTGLGEENLHEGDIIVMHGCDNPIEEKIQEISPIIKELTAADIPEEKVYISEYAKVIKRLEEEGKCEDITYDFIYLNDDQIPELVAGHLGYWASVYTYAAGERHTVFEEFGYGVGGRSAYEYIPRESVIRCLSADNAGLVVYTEFYRMNESCEAEEAYYLKKVLFDDDTGNEVAWNSDSENVEWHYYYEEQEVSLEEYNSYDVSGEYEYIEGSKTDVEILEEMREMLYAE